MFSSWLVDTITVARYSGSVSDYGDPITDPQVTMKARVEESVQTIRDIDGNERNVTHAIATSEPISERDLIWIPGKDTGNESEALRPVSVRTAANKSGNFRFYMTLL